MSELQGAINQSTYLHTLIAERDARLRDLEQALAEANIRLSDCSACTCRFDNDQIKPGTMCAAHADIVEDLAKKTAHEFRDWIAEHLEGFDVQPEEARLLKRVVRFVRASEANPEAPK